MKLNKRTIDSIQAQSRDRVYWDSELPGFGLRVKPSGVKSFIIQYRNQQGRSRRHTVGRYGVVTAEQARKDARDLLVQVGKGQDPTASQNAARSAPSMADLCARYLVEHAEVHKKPRSVKEDRRLIDKRIEPAMRHMAVEAVTRADVSKVHHGLRESPYEANRVLALLSKMFNLAEAWGLRPDGSNPTRHVKRFPEKKHERFLSPEELGRLGTVLDDADRTREIHPTLVAAIRLLLLTGCRRSETLSFRWAWIDWEAGTVRLPDSKTGAKTIHLGTAGLDVLAKLPQDSPYCLNAIQDREQPLGKDTLDHAWRRVRDKAGLAGVRLHDLRHTFASWAVMGGQTLPMTGALLGHKTPQTTHRYYHIGNNPLSQAAEQVSGRLAEALTPRHSER